MCTVDKMLIKGIRSFSPENQHVIEFYKPLTLIVGSNGAGKTTIIECLRQACTGEMPPNTGGNGRNWVMDPKIAGESEVKAQVKLRFKTSTGMPVVVARSYQSVQRKTGQPMFKSLDAVVQNYNKDTGEKQALTYKCADINTTVPALMGVSKAVLDNVIFVHQEDSNWPLADGATLKKKFDEIFSATKYTKFLENVRKIRLEKAQQAKELKLQLETLRAHKDAAHKLRTAAASGTHKAEQQEAQRAELEQQHEVLMAEIAALDAALERISETDEQAAKLRAQLDLLLQQQAEKEAALTNGDFDEGDQDLTNWMNDFDQQMAQLRRQAQDMERQVDAKGRLAAELKEQHTQESIHLGKLQAEADAHARNQQDLEAFIRQAALEQDISMPGLLGRPASGSLSSAGSGSFSLAPAVVDAFKFEHESRRSRAAQELEDARATFRRENEELNQELDRAQAEVSGAAEKGRMMRQQALQLRSKVDNLQMQASSISVNTALLEELRGRELETTQKLEARRAEEARGSEDASATRLKEEVEALGRRVAALRQERDSAASASESATRLRLKASDLNSKKEALTSLYTSPKGQQLLRLAGISGATPEAAAAAAMAPGRSGEQVRVAAEQALSGKVAKVAARLAEATAADKKASAVSGELAAVRQQLAAKETAAAGLREELQAALLALPEPPAELLGVHRDGAEAEAYNNCLNNCEQVVAARTKKLRTSEVLQQTLAMYRSQVEQEEGCPLCTRAWAGNDRAVCLDSIDAEMSELPNHIASLQQDLDTRARELERLKALLPTYHQYSSLLGELGPLKGKVAQLHAEAGAAGDAAAAASEAHAIADAELAGLKRALGEVGWQAAALSGELRDLQQYVSVMEATLKSQAAAGRSVGDIDAELGAVEVEKQQKEVALEELARRISKGKDERVRLSEELAGIKDQLRAAGDSQRRKAALTTQLKEVQQQEAEANAAAEAAAAAQAPAGARKDAVMARRAAARTAQQQLEQRLEAAVRQYADLLDGLATKQRALEAYAGGGRAAELGRVKQRLEDLSTRLTATQQEMSRMQEERRTQEARLREQVDTRSEIAACLDYRRVKAAAEELQRQLDQLAASAGQVGSKADLLGRRTQLGAQADQLRSRAFMAAGAASAERAAAEEAARELRAPQYAQIQQRFRQQMVEVKTVEMACGDLERYHKALEKALLAFHTNKMTDINKVIKELWQRTYRWQDIDCIQIRADADGSARSYNYRVVMDAGGVELDMRGRCSAGQKVLACLIIRLALAETFCLNCGILALDEPTTNLDADNSASLAEALRAIMLARRGQENFQLIVITHDENFARQIGTREHAEYMWRVTKDPDQHSHIAQEEIVE